MFGKKARQKQKHTYNEIELIELAKFYFINTKYDEAVKELEKVLKINPKNAEAYYNLGLIYENRTQGDKARDMYERALDIDPDYKLAKEHLNRLIGISND